jgi:hypothetical protein
MDNMSGRPITKIINPVIEIKAPFVPTSLSLGLSIIMARFESSVGHIAQVFIIDPEQPEKPLYSAPVQNLPSAMPGNNTVINVNVRNLGFMHTGEYRARLIFDGQLFEGKFFIVADKILKVVSDTL